MRTLSHSIVQLTPQRMESRVFRERPSCPRSPGVHVQEINRYLAIAAGKLKESPEDFPRFSVDFYPLLPALGVAWEDAWSTLHTEDELLWQPGEQERDGIYGTPDGIMWQSGAVAECKLTLKKMKPVEDEWLYIRQGLSYCALMGFTLVEYHVFWVLSDYMRPYKPTYDVTLVEFSKHEIEQWWSRVLAVKDRVKPE